MKDNKTIPFVADQSNNVIESVWVPAMALFIIHAINSSIVFIVNLIIALHHLVQFTLSALWENNKVN